MNRALIAVIKPGGKQVCEICFARPAIGTFNVDDVETPLCNGCSVYRNGDNTQVIIPNESV